MFSWALWEALCAAAHSSHQTPWDPELGGRTPAGTLCLWDGDHHGDIWKALSNGHGGCTSVGIAETDPEDPIFPAAAGALREDCLEQQGFPSINILLRWKAQFVPPRVIASSCL